MEFEKFMKGSSDDLTKIERKDLIDSRDFLITDENEAIKGYDRVILLVENSNRPDKSYIIKKLKFIREQELEHIRILKDLL